MCAAGSSAPARRWTWRSGWSRTGWPRSAATRGGRPAIAAWPFPRTVPAQSRRSPSRWPSTCTTPSARTTSVRCWACCRPTSVPGCEPCAGGPALREEDMIAEDTEPDPLTGRHGYEREGGIWAPRLRGRFRPSAVDRAGPPHRARRPRRARGSRGCAGGGRALGRCGGGRRPRARHGDAGGRRRCPLRLERTRCHIELGDFSGADVDLDVVAGSGRRLATAARALRADSLPRRERWQAARAEATDALNAGPPLWPSALLMAVAWEAAARLGEAGAAPVPTEAHVRTLRLHGRAAWVDRMVELGERGAAFDPACAAIRPDRPRVGRQRALTGVRRPPPSWEDGPVTSSAAAGRSSPGCCCSPPVRSPAAWPRRRRG